MNDNKNELPVSPTDAIEGLRRQLVEALLKEIEELRNESGLSRAEAIKGLREQLVEAHLKEIKELRNESGLSRAEAIEGLRRQLVEAHINDVQELRTESGLSRAGAIERLRRQLVEAHLKEIEELRTESGLYRAGGIEELRRQLVEAHSKEIEELEAESGLPRAENREDVRIRLLEAHVKEFKELRTNFDLSGGIEVLRTQSIDAHLKNIDQLYNDTFLFRAEDIERLRIQSIEAHLKEVDELRTKTLLLEYQNNQSAPDNTDIEENKQTSEIKRAFSDDMKTAASPFIKYETTTKSVDAYVSIIKKISSNHSDLKLVWRGQADADWGLHSSLYRRLLASRDLDKFDGDVRKKKFILPSEEDMVSAEKKFLKIARKQWRADGTSALELFATLQHLGAPTRFIDVTKNPLIALYFALGDPEEIPTDGRVFALATEHVKSSVGETTEIPESVNEAVRMSEIELSEPWSNRDPIWHNWLLSKKRQEHNWGTGSIRRVWFPPDYVERIVAQNAGFLFDGVPIWTKKHSTSFIKTKNTYWNRNEVIRSGSIYAKYYKTGQRQSSDSDWAPTFSIRIPAGNKDDIRETLNKRFGINYPSLFPDKFALAQFLDNTKFL